MVKILKTKYKEKSLKKSQKKKKKAKYLHENKDSHGYCSFIRNYSDQKIVEQYRKVLKGKKNVNPKFYTQKKICFKNECTMKTFSDKRN